MTVVSVDLRGTSFLVEEVYVITGRGPCVVRSREAAKKCLGRFRAGDWVTCGDLRAKVVGVEAQGNMGFNLAAQQGLLLRIDDSLLERGQVWYKEEYG